TTVCGTFNWNGNDYTASGNYSFATVNAAGCDSFAFLSLTIIAAPTTNAGPDQTIDAGATALLDGVVTNAIGGFWIGGNGTYAPDNTDLNAVYTPSAQEIIDGSVTLTLTSNQNACGLVAISAVTIFISPTAPITLLSFNGYKNGKSNKLTWTSANEVNNRGFEIQRSYNGVDFTKIGFVNSLAPGGNSTGNLNYQFADVNYLGSIQYYRLLQMDYDNHSKLSNVVVIKDGNLTTLTIDGIYPNPTTANINVLITSPNQQKSTVIIYDATGRTVAKQTITLNSGNNIIPFDVHNFASGTYTVNLISINSNVAGKFIKK
ncbi:MAG: T9SS type A sorting domain-containing protein, partial [Bacteroidota bacterium]